MKGSGSNSDKSAHTYRGAFTLPKQRPRIIRFFKCDEGEDRTSHFRLTTQEEMVSPYNETNSGNGYGRCSNSSVTKNVFSGVNGDRLGDYTESGKNHYVYNGVGIEPEEVLKQHWVTTAFRPEEAGAEAEIEQQHHGTTGEGRQSHQLDGLGSPGGPDEHRHLEKPLASCPDTSLRKEHAIAKPSMITTSILVLERGTRYNRPDR